MQAEKIIRKLNKLKTGAPCSDVHSRDMAIEEAKEAIQKQKVKKKPTIDVYEYDVFSYICPCGAEVCHYQSYCDVCGQALDWSDTK